MMLNDLFSVGDVMTDFLGIAYDGSANNRDFSAQ
jgi:hypothetical protein